MSFDSSEMSYFSDRQQRMKSEDQDSVAGMAELHSQSVTPTPDEEQQHLLLPLPLPQAIESDSEVEGFNLATGITTELAPRMSNAHTPEVSYTSANNTAPASTNPNESKPPPSWRRSKYYENITKQTIKGFLWEIWTSCPSWKMNTKRFPAQLTSAICFSADPRHSCH